MELRKSSIYGKINPKTGHVPSPQDVEIHSEIRNLYDKEVDEQIIAEEEAIQDDDFKTIHGQSLEDASLDHVPLCMSTMTFPFSIFGYY